MAAAIQSIKNGTFGRGFTLFVLPLRNELALGVTAITVAEMLGRMEGGLIGPGAGFLTDRLGPRIILAAGGIISGVGFILLYFTHSYVYFLLVFVGLISLGFRGGYQNASLPAVNQWFIRKRAMAMSLASTGSGVGGAVVAPLLGLMILTLGWRPAAMISGIAVIAIVLPLSMLVKRSPESMGLHPDGDEPTETPEAGTPETATPEATPLEPSGSSPTGMAHQTGITRRPTAEADFSVKEAMGTASFWLIVLATGLRNTVHSGLAFLMAPVMVWFMAGGGRGETEGLAISSLFIGAMSLGNLFFKPIIGLVGDKWSKQRLSALAMIAGSLSILALLNQSGALWQLGVFVTLLAFAESANPLTAAIIGDFFGRRSFATLRGWQHLPGQFMSMSTPLWMALIFDNTGSFYWALLPLVVIYALSAVFYWTLPAPGPPARLAQRLTAGTQPAR